MATLKNLPQLAILILDNGSEVEVQKLGKGRYTTAWRSITNPRRVYLQVKDGPDYSKEILSQIQNHIHIPDLERLEDLGDQRLYATRYYEPLTAKSKTAWAQFRKLPGVRRDSMAQRLRRAAPAPRHTAGQ